VRAALQPADELVERDRRHRHAGDAAARAGLDGHARDGGVIRRLDDGDEIVGAQASGSIRDDRAAPCVPTRTACSASRTSTRRASSAVHALAQRSAVYQTGASRLDALRNIYTDEKSFRPRPWDDASRSACCAAGATTTGTRSSRAALTASPRSFAIRSVVKPGA